MTKVQFSPRARADLKEIGRYSKQEFGISAAEKYLLGFEECFDLLRKHPEAGQVREGLGRGVRSLLHRRHRIFYTILDGSVLIVRILHHSRDVPRHLPA